MYNPCHEKGFQAHYTPSQPIVQCQIDPINGLDNYMDELGNVYKMAPHLVSPQHMHAHRKGESSPRFDPNDIPPVFFPSDPTKFQYLYKAPKIPLEFGSMGIQPSTKEVPTFNLVPQVTQEPLNVNALHNSLAYKKYDSQEYMLVVNFQLTHMISNATIPCLYVNEKENYFQLLSLKCGKPTCQSEIIRTPTICKYMHVTHLAYTYYKDKVGNKYKP